MVLWDEDNRFCEAVRGNIMGHNRARIDGDLLIIDHPNMSDMGEQIYSLRAGKLIKMCGGWMSFHTQTRCIEGMRLERYLNGDEPQAAFN